MKKSLLLMMTAFAVIAGAFLTSCNSSADKLETAKNDVIVANKELAETNKEYLKDIENYRKEIDLKAAENDNNIAKLTKAMKQEKKKVKAGYKRQIAVLAQKNKDLKKQMDEYKEDGRVNWEKFKSEFSHDMDELGKAFKDVTDNNVK